MSQIPLFVSSSESVLVDDERGRVAYTPAFLAIDVAEAWFAELRQSVPWKTQRRRMYDRDVDVPRLLAHFRLDEEDGAPDAIRVAAEKAVAFTGVPFNRRMGSRKPGRRSARASAWLSASSWRMTLRRRAGFIAEGSSARRRT